MRSRRRPYARRVAAVVGAVLLSGVGTGVAGASPGGAEAAGRPAEAARVERAVQAVPQTTAIDYGPYTIQAAPPNPDGSHGHAHTGNRFALNVRKPCSNCYITRMQADLIKADGTRAGFSNNLQLHHMVLFNRETGRTDATCGNSALGALGQRFFASGDERTDHTLPDGYGYRVGTGQWNLIWDLASMSNVPETVNYRVTFEWVPDTTPGMTDVEPVWFDVDQCGDSNVDIPAGPSSQRWTWTVNRPGDLLTVVNHLHDHGVNLEMRNDTTGQVLCNGVARYGETPLYVDHHGTRHISSVGTCGGRGATRPVATLREGERVTITSHYNAPAATGDAMGISVAYVGQPRQGPGPSGCHTATNSAHVQAGRATAFLFFAFAVGSNQYLGLTSATTSLREQSAGNWVRVASC